MIGGDGYLDAPVEANATWLRWVPLVVRSRLQDRQVLQAILSNTSWLIVDRVLRMGVGLLVGVWLARYLGPTQFGIWNYATAFTYLFSAIATLGLDSIVIRELVRTPERQHEVMGTAFVLKLIAALVTVCITVGSIAIAKRGDRLVIELVAIAASGFLFQSLNVIDFYFQAQTKARFTVYAANGAFLLMTIVKVVLLLRRAPLIAFAWAGLGEIVLTSAFLLVAFRLRRQRVSGWTFKWPTARALLRDSWPLVFSGMAVGIFMKIDQIMLEALVDARAVGLYAAAVRVSEVWYFLGSVVITSVAPTIYRAKHQSEAAYRQKLQSVFGVMFWMAMAISLTLSLLSSIIIRTLFGPAYASAGHVLLIHTWSTIFVFVGLAQGIFWIAENLQAFSLLLTVSAAVTNILLNLVLIPLWGINGAAVATLVAYGVPTLILPAFFSKTRPLIGLFLRSATILPRL